MECAQTAAPFLRAMNAARLYDPAKSAAYSAQKKSVRMSAPRLRPTGGASRPAFVRSQSQFDVRRCRIRRRQERPKTAATCLHRQLQATGG